jgi:hypothetical protein
MFFKVCALSRRIPEPGDDRSAATMFRTLFSRCGHVLKVKVASHPFAKSCMRLISFIFFSFCKLHSETVFSTCQLLQWECPLATHMSYRRSRAPRRVTDCHVQCRTYRGIARPLAILLQLQTMPARSVIRIHRLRIMIPHRLPSFRMRRSHGPGLIFTINPLPTGGAGNFSLGF